MAGKTLAIVGGMMGRGLDELTPTILPETMMPISVADVGAVVPVTPIDGLVAFTVPLKPPELV